MNKTAIFYGSLVTIVILALIISSDLNKPRPIKPEFAKYVTESILSKDTTNTYGDNLQVLNDIHSKTQLLNVIFGNSSIQPGLRVEDVSLPEALLGRFAGPRFGTAGLRGRRLAHRTK